MQCKAILSIRLSPDGLSFWVNPISEEVSGKKAPKKSSRNRKRQKDQTITHETYLTFDHSLSPTQNVEACMAKIIEATSALIACNGEKCAQPDNTNEAPTSSDAPAINESANYTPASQASLFHTVDLYPDTLSCTLIPTVHFEAGSEKHYMASCNIELLEGENIFQTTLDNDTLALTAFDPTLTEAVSQACGMQCTMRSPFNLVDAALATDDSKRRRGVSIYLTTDYVYVGIYEKKGRGRLYCESLKWAAPADILYILSILDKEFGLKKSIVYIRGARAEEVHKLVLDYFKKSRLV